MEWHACWLWQDQIHIHAIFISLYSFDSATVYTRICRYVYVHCAIYFLALSSLVSPVSFCSHFRSRNLLIFSISHLLKLHILFTVHIFYTLFSQINKCCVWTFEHYKNTDRLFSECRKKAAQCQNDFIMTLGKLADTRGSRHEEIFNHANIFSLFSAHQCLEKVFEYNNTCGYFENRRKQNLRQREDLSPFKFHSYIAICHIESYFFRVDLFYFLFRIFFS